MLGIQVSGANQPKVFQRVSGFQPIQKIRAISAGRNDHELRNLYSVQECKLSFDFLLFQRERGRPNQVDEHSVRLRLLELLKGLLVRPSPPALRQAGAMDKFGYWKGRVFHLAMAEFEHEGVPKMQGIVHAIRLKLRKIRAACT